MRRCAHHGLTLEASAVVEDEFRLSSEYAEGRLTMKLVLSLGSASSSETSSIAQATRHSLNTEQTSKNVKKTKKIFFKTLCTLLVDGERGLANV